MREEEEFQFTEMQKMVLGWGIILVIMVVLWIGIIALVMWAF